jgi:hypothetical protein
VRFACLLGRNHGKTYKRKYEDYFDLVYIDPPFREPECVELNVAVVKAIAKKKGGRIIFCTGSIFEETMQQSACASSLPLSLTHSLPPSRPRVSKHALFVCLPRLSLLDSLLCLRRELCCSAPHRTRANHAATNTQPEKTRKL